MRKPKTTTNIHGALAFLIGVVGATAMMSLNAGELVAPFGMKGEGLVLVLVIYGIARLVLFMFALGQPEPRSDEPPAVHKDSQQ